MKNDLTCGLVKDLLPSYADGLTGNETNEAVARHLAACPDCKAAYDKISAPVPALTENDGKELSYLKKIKKKHLISALCVALAALLLAGGAFGALYAKRVYAKSPVTRGVLDITELTVDANGSHVLLCGRLPDGLTAASGGKMAFDPATGKLTVSPYMRKALRNETTALREEFRTSETVKSVYLDNVPLWENGAVISERVGLAFAAAHPYMGDIMQNLQSAEALEIGKTFGAFTNELRTSSQPYVWAMHFENPMTEMNEAEIQTELTLDAVLLLATIENLERVDFIYTLPYGNSGRVGVLRLTTDDADAVAGMRVKEAGKTAAGLQELYRTFWQRINETITIRDFIVTTEEGARVIGFRSVSP